MDFYYMPASPSCCAVMMAAKALGLTLNKKVVNLLKNDHLTAEFAKLNPQCTVPTLVDNGFSIWESRAILIYLVETYDKANSLYPKSPIERAIVHQRLYFDVERLYKSFGDYYVPHLRLKKPADPLLFKKMEEAFELLNIFLVGHEYVAGEHLTIADLSILATVSTFELVGFDITKYPNVRKWYEKSKKTNRVWDGNWEGFTFLKRIFFGV